MAYQGRPARGTGWLAILLTGWAVAAPAAAQEEAAAPVTDLDELVVTVGRQELLQSETPAPVSVIDRDAIERRQARSIDDLLRDAPGVTISGGPRRAALMPTIRGLTDGRVVVRIDGARQNMQIRHRGQTFLDPSLLQRVEVLRGPASTLFGSGAIGGVVDFRTLDAGQFLDEGERFGGRLMTGYQSNADETIGSLSLAGRQGDFGLLGGITRSRSDDFEDGNGDTEPFSGNDLVSGLVKGSWTPAGPSRLSVTYLDYYDDSDSRTTADRPRGDAVRRLTRQRTASLQYGFRPAGSALWDLAATLYRTDLSLDGRTLETGDRSLSELATTGLDLFNNSRASALGVDHLLTYGIELYRDEQTGRENGVPDPGFASSEQNTVGAFVQDRLLLTDRATLTLGVRFDYIEQEADREGEETSRFDEWSPQATFSYQLLGGLSAYASYAEAFRAPNLRELFVAGEHFPGNTYLPNPDLQPERAHNKEVGLNYLRRGIWTGGDRLRGSVSLYQNDIEDFLEQIVRGGSATGGLANTTRFENTEDARLRGAEIELRYDHPAFYAAIIGSLLRGDDEGEDEPLEGMPADSLTVIAAVTPPGRGLETGVRVEMVARQDRLPPTTDPDAAGPAPGYAVTDLFLRAPIAGGLDLELRMDNVFDRTYRRATNLINSPGRNLRAQIAYRF